MGRSWHNGAKDTRENAAHYGLNFDEQWRRVMQEKPKFVFVTGWNEWIAGRFQEWSKYSHEDSYFKHGMFVDQFDQGKLIVFDIKKPTRLCVPVEVDDDAVIAEDINLMCYQVKRAQKQSKHVKVQGIYVNNQFAVEQLGPDANWMVDTVKEEEFCVPSLIGKIEK